MQDLLTAASPVEIEAIIDTHGLGRDVQDEALALFHQLTSTLELAEIGLARRRATDWPAHRFWCELRPGTLAALVATLEAEPEALRLVDPMPAGAVAPAILFVATTRKDRAAMLVACADPMRLEQLAARLVPVA